MPRGLTLVARLLLWVLTYYVTGILSLEFDDPLSQVPLVWFPSGVAVAAFLCCQRSRWPALFLALVLTRFFLDDSWRHDLTSTLVFSGVGLSTALGIAWVVRRLARPNDDLHAILLWLLATIGLCAIEALLIGGWLAMTRDLPLARLFWLIWIANGSGIIFATVAVMSLLNVDFNHRHAGLVARSIGLVALALMCLSTWLIFRVDPERLLIGSSGDEGTALDFALACVPIIFAVIVSVTWGGRGATLALLALAGLVIHNTDQGHGPFFLKGLNQDEPLLLAQSYLCATALLLVFLRILARTTRRYDLETGRLAGEGVMYRLDLASGTLIWDDNLSETLQLDPQALSTIGGVLECVHPKDRDRLRHYWSAARRRSSACSIAFRITGSDDAIRYIRDQTPSILTGSSGEVIVGNWQINHYR